MHDQLNATERRETEKANQAMFYGPAMMLAIQEAKEKARRKVIRETKVSKLEFKRSEIWLRD